MKKRIAFGFLTAFLMFTITLAGCSEEDEPTPVEPTYALQNDKFYWCQLDSVRTHEACFRGDRFFYSTLGPGGGGTTSCRYTYFHPVVTLYLSSTETYQFIVGENYLKFKTKKGEDFILYQRKEYGDDSEF